MVGGQYELPEKLIPNAYELTEIYKQEQAHTEVLIAQLVTGSQPPDICSLILCIRWGLRPFRIQHSARAGC